MTQAPSLCLARSPPIWKSDRVPQCNLISGGNVSSSFSPMFRLKAALENRRHSGSTARRVVSMIYGRKVWTPNLKYWALLFNTETRWKVKHSLESCRNVLKNDCNVGRSVRATQLFYGSFVVKFLFSDYYAFFLSGVCCNLSFKFNGKPSYSLCFHEHYGISKELHQTVAQ